MKLNNWLPYLTVGLLFLAAQGLNRPVVQAQAESPPNNIAWEYKIARANEETLNQLGAEGWEAIAAVGDVKGQSAGMRAISTTEKVILKRRKAN